MNCSFFTELCIKIVEKSEISESVQFTPLNSNKNSLNVFLQDQDPDEEGRALSPQYALLGTVFTIHDSFIIKFSFYVP